MKIQEKNIYRRNKKDDNISFNKNLFQTLKHNLSFYTLESIA